MQIKKICAAIEDLVAEAGKTEARRRRRLTTTATTRMS